MRNTSYYIARTLYTKKTIANLSVAPIGKGEEAGTVGKFYPTTLLVGAINMNLSVLLGGVIRVRLTSCWHMHPHRCRLDYRVLID